MELSEMLGAVSTVGFPIFMCVLLFWYMEKQNERHTEESKEMRDAINELKVAITTLTERIAK